MIEKTNNYNKVLEIEDLLHKADPSVFVDGIGGRSADMMAWMTCIQFNALNTFLSQHAASFSQEVWKEALDYWNYISYLSPIPKLLVFGVEQFFQRLNR